MRRTLLAFVAGVVSCRIVDRLLSDSWRIDVEADALDPAPLDRTRPWSW